jgi:hypothetical protein
MFLQEGREKDGVKRLKNVERQRKGRIKKDRIGKV